MAPTSVSRSCVFIPVLVLMGALPAGHGQDAQCMTKYMECNTMVSSAHPQLQSLAQSDFNALEQECSSLMQSLGDCVSEGKTICKSAEEKTRLDDIMKGLYENMCGRSSICRSRAMVCGAQLAAVSDSAGNGSSGLNILAQMCPMVCWHNGDPFALHHISRALHRRVIPDRCPKPTHDPYAPAKS